MIKQNSYPDMIRKRSKTIRKYLIFLFILCCIIVAALSYNTVSFQSNSVVNFLKAPLSFIKGSIYSLIQGYFFQSQNPNELSGLLSPAEFHHNFDKIRPDVKAGTDERADIAIGFATSMEKVLPRTGEIAADTAQQVFITLARNEKESFQVIIVPYEKDLQQVQVQITDLQSIDKTIFAAKNIDAVPMGYVQTKTVPPYGSSYVGWWPDPILNFMPICDIAKGDVQSFWVRIRAPKNQSAGFYQGKLNVLVEGKRVFTFDLKVRVYPFTLPDISPLPLAITFAPDDDPIAETKKQQEEWQKSPDYPINIWKRHRMEWVDFLADYYITYDCLYNYGPETRIIPDFEALNHLNQQGRLGRFNLGYWDDIKDESETTLVKWQNNTLKRIRSAYDQAKAFGILDHAYLYGCDEYKSDLFPGVERAAKRLKQEFPNVMILTTSRDYSYGTKSILKSIDAFCPQTSDLNIYSLADARKAGKQIWWYVCCGPYHPHLNMFIEYPAIEGRLLSGFMTAKYRMDGFLYYQISFWNSQKPITSGPFTDWDPRTYQTYHGDGSWTCVGPDGIPLPTIRLENFRDGLEDYAYLRILEATVAKVEASKKLRSEKAEWLKQAKALLTVPDKVIKSLTEFSYSPSILYSYRNKLAEAISTAGVEPVSIK